MCLKKPAGLRATGRRVVIAPPLLPSASVIISNLQRVGDRNGEEEPSKAVNLKKWKKRED